MTLTQQVRLLGAFAALWTAVRILAAQFLYRYSPYQTVWGNVRYLPHVHAGRLAWCDPVILLRIQRPFFVGVAGFPTSLAFDHAAARRPATGWAPLQVLQC
jgi:hypothetical protein